MIKERSIKEYITADGTVFRDKAKAEKHEINMRAVSSIMSSLPALPELNSGEYYQHDKYDLLKVKRQLFDLVISELGDQYPSWKEFSPDEVHPLSIISRVLEDYSDNIPLSKAWRRLANYNFELGREYNQPFFALNPEKALEKKI